MPFRQGDEEMKRIMVKILQGGWLSGLSCRRKNNSERKKRSRRKNAPDPPPTGSGARTGRVSLGAFRLRRGSLTVESALVLPLFFFGMTAMISMMDLYRTETVHLSELCQNAKVAATYTYNPVGGSFEDIVLPDIYSFRPVGGIFSLPKVRRFNIVRVRTWNGKEHVTTHASLMREQMVYVTASGSVYHRSLACRYLNVSTTAISSAQLATRRNRSGKRYTACERCARGAPAPLVYVTATGDRYHNDQTCSSLKRSVRMIRESEAIGMRPCSVCGGEK